ncbi:MAG: RNA polymerase subunit AC19 [Bogoriella megaspora]|nr:MAG: RNA polymerase subunit AC19 [Bogoriella megaspora]
MADHSPTSEDSTARFRRLVALSSAAMDAMNSQQSQQPATQDSLMPDVEVPSSSTIVPDDAQPSTPPSRLRGATQDDTVMETPTNGKSYEQGMTDGDGEDQAEAGAENVNGNGNANKRPVWTWQAPQNPRDPGEIGVDEQRLRLLSGSLEDAASFEFMEEGHTFGNALRHVIMKNPKVELCGYTIPHPSESKMHVRIQTYDGASAHDVLEKGIDDLDDMCEVILTKFATAKAEYEETNR